jgi:hypothetical protein
VRRHTKPVKGVIVLDLRPFAAAMARAARSIITAFDNFAAAFTPAGRLRVARHQHGGNGTDARRWPDLWQSAPCSAWLHESCPSDAHALGCTCGCHA